VVAGNVGFLPPSRPAAVSLIWRIVPSIPNR
jgi:hypothetical protein